MKLNNAQVKESLLTALSRAIIGRKSLLELLRNKPNSIEMAYVTAGLKLAPDLSKQLEVAVSRGLSVVEIEKGLLDEVFPGAVHQGVVTVLDSMSECSFENLLTQSCSLQGRGLIVVLDQVSDPQNLGAVLRVSEAAGADGVIATKDNSAPLSDVAKKASAGASELIPFCRVTNLVRALEELKRHEFWVVGAAIDENTEGLYSFTFPARTALVLGAEGKGLRKLTRDACDLGVEIPLDGKIQSLNVSQAASVLLFESLRQRKK